MSYQLQEINRRIDQDVKGFLEECDAQYAQKVSQAADAIFDQPPPQPHRPALRPLRVGQDHHRPED